MNEAEINNHHRFFEENNFEEIINQTTNLNINIWEILEKEQNLKTTGNFPIMKHFTSCLQINLMTL